MSVSHLLSLQSKNQNLHLFKTWTQPRGLHVTPHSTTTMHYECKRTKYLFSKRKYREQQRQLGKNPSPFFSSSHSVWPIHYSPSLLESCCGFGVQCIWSTEFWGCCALWADSLPFAMLPLLPSARAQGRLGWSRTPCHNTQLSSNLPPWSATPGAEPGSWASNCFKIRGVKRRISNSIVATLP